MEKKRKLEEIKKISTIEWQMMNNEVAESKDDSETKGQGDGGT